MSNPQGEPRIWDEHKSKYPDGNVAWKRDAAPSQDDRSEGPPNTSYRRDKSIVTKDSGNFKSTPNEGLPTDKEWDNKLETQPEQHSL